MKVDILPALIQCFAIILIGYLIARFNVITSSQGRGISLFLLHILLPALIFKALVQVDFPAVNWKVWGGVFIAKTVVFIIVAIATAIFAKEDKFSKAGLYSIFVTQSNDFAFGLPILESVFNSPNNKFLVDYIYMVAPINLAFLNSVGFSMMEYGKAKKRFVESANGEGSVNETKRKKRKLLLKIVSTTLKGIVTNPLIIATVVGICFNFILKQKIPGFLLPFFTTLSSAFGASALFYLGWSLGNSPVRIKGFDLVLPMVLVIMKGILLPIIMKTTVTWLVDIKSGRNNTLPTEVYATFGFIYGAIPTAPPVVVFATKYDLPEEIVANGLVLGTILCAPILFASVQMLKVPTMHSLKLYWDLVAKVSMDASIFTVVFSVWVLAVMIVLQFYKRRPHQNMIVLVIFQLLIGLMGACYPVYKESESEAVQKFCIFLLLLAIYGQCCWTMVLAFSMAFPSMRSKSLLYGVPALGLTLPVLLSGIKVATDSKVFLPTSPYLYLACYDKFMDAGIIFIVLNIIMLLGIIICLVKMNKSDLFDDALKKRKKSVRDRTRSKEGTEREHLLNGSADKPTDSEGYGTSSGEEQYTINTGGFARKHTSASESSLSSCEVELEEEQQLSKMDFVGSPYTANHIICLLLIGFTSMVNLAVALWYLVMRQMIGGLYLELLMLGVVLTFAQGFIPFVTFGFVKEFCSLPIFERFHCNCCVWLKRKRIEVPNHDELDTNVKLLCVRFMTNHYIKCANDILTDICLRANRRRCKDVFTGISLVDWLINSGLVNDRGEAVEYGNKLLLGGVIAHLTGDRYFYDLPYLYKFSESSKQYLGDTEEYQIE